MTGKELKQQLRKRLKDIKDNDNILAHCLIIGEGDCVTRYAGGNVSYLIGMLEMSRINFTKLLHLSAN